jgi:O-antigen/teichoic acid export membrane protein
MHLPLSVESASDRIWHRAIRVASRGHALALTDQAIVSGTSLLTTLLIARWSNPAQLGVYTVGTTLLLSVVGFQESLILEPYLIQRYYTHATPRERAGASLALSFGFSALSMLVCAIAVVAFITLSYGSEVISTTAAIAIIIPFALSKNFARRFLFARLEFAGALVLDLAVACIQLSTLVWLGRKGHMSALSAWVALGAANALAAIGWLYHARADFLIRMRHVSTVMRQSWPLGKWLLVGQVTALLQGNITYWLSITIAGAAVTGLFAACMGIVGFANPMLLGLGNSFMPRSVIAWNNGGGRRLFREALRNTALVAVLMIAFTLGIVFVGESLMTLLFHGAEYQGYRHMLIVLALSMLAGALGSPAQFALAAMERPRPIVASATVGSIATVILVCLLMTRWGLLGAAYGLLGGGAFGSAARWVAFLRVAHLGMPSVRSMIPEYEFFIDCKPKARRSATKRLLRTLHRLRRISSN